LLVAITDMSGTNIPVLVIVGGAPSEIFPEDAVPQIPVTLIQCLVRIVDEHSTPVAEVDVPEAELGGDVGVLIRLGRRCVDWCVSNRRRHQRQPRREYPLQAHVVPLSEETRCPQDCSSRGSANGS